jgi:hypothetical protein
MHWARMVAYLTGTVNQELLLRNEYLGAENRIHDSSGFPHLLPFFDAQSVVVLGSGALRFKLGSIKGSKKSGFGPYATPPKRLRIFEFLVRDQEDSGSNPLAPTKGAIAKGVGKLDRNTVAWRKLYFLRNSTKTLAEIRSAIETLRQLTTFQELLAKQSKGDRQKNRILLLDDDFHSQSG